MPHTTLAQRVLPQPACSVEFCSVTGDEGSLAMPDGHQLMAVGTYFLADRETQKKEGKVQLFRVLHNETPQVLESEPLTAQASGCLASITELDMSAVFDIKWRSTASGTDYPCMGVVRADSCLAIVQVQQEIIGTDGIKLHEVCKEPLGDEGIMALSLDWGHPSHPSASETVAVSSSDGRLSVIKAEGAGLQIEASWEAHELEAWVVAKDRFQPAVLYSGADDCRMKVWDTRAGYGVAQFVDRRTHEMGVCCIQSHPTVEHILCTGSYDEKARLWDARNLSRPVTTAVYETGGGVWRLKWHPFKQGLLLAASMHAGFHVLRVNASWSEIETVESYTEHESLAYGADWMRRENAGDNRDIIGTCSFYDKELRVWECTAADE